jgi:hypothetical protein
VRAPAPAGPPAAGRTGVGVPELEAGGRRKGGGEEERDGGVGWGSREWGPTRRSG